MRIKKINKFLDNNQIVAFPTDSIFGLSTKVSPENMKALNSLKESKENKPLIIMFANRKLCYKACELTRYQKTILDAELPGRKTFILKPTKKFSKKYLDGEKTIAVRVPLSKFKDLESILDHHDMLFTTSINISGEDFLNDSKSIRGAFSKNDLPYVSPGMAKYDKPSMIISLIDEKIEIIREGE